MRITWGLASLCLTLLAPHCRSEAVKLIIDTDMVGRVTASNLYFSSYLSRTLMLTMSGLCALPTLL